MTDKLISDLSAIGAAIADNTATEVQRNGQTTTEQALGSDWKTYIQSWLTKAMVGLGNVANSLQLVAASNLSDLTDASAARSNLQLGFGALQNRLYMFNDFFGATADFGFVAVQNGTGAGTAVVAPGSLNAIGITSLGLGTTTTGRCGYSANGGSSGITILKLGSGRARFQAKAAIHTLSNGTDTYTARLGFQDQVLGDSSNGVYFRYTDGVNSGKWQAVTRSGGSETAADTGIAPVADTWHLMTIDVNAAGTSAVFSIDGSTVATATLTIPTGAGKETGWSIAAVKSVGTTSTIAVYIDFAEVELNLTSAR